MKKKSFIGKNEKSGNSETKMALWGSSVRSRSRPPLLSIPENQNIVEIQGDWEVLPAARMTKNGPTVSRVLIRKSHKKFEKNLNGRKRRKSA